MIIEINEWDDPENLDYQELAKTVKGVIIRVQDGLELDPTFHRHAAGFKQAGVPVAVSGVVTGRNAAEMAKEAEAFWYRGKDVRPTFWWLEMPEETMEAMKDGLAVYHFFLKALGAERIGICTTAWLSEELAIDRRKFQGTWIKDVDEFDCLDLEDLKSCDLHQGLTVGSCPGCEAWLNEVRILRHRGFSRYFGQENKIPQYMEQWQLLTEPKRRKGGNRK